jgi:hypothetical protein
MQAADVPGLVWRAAGVDVRDVAGVASQTFDTGTGAASGRTELISAELRGGRQVDLIRKTFQPVLGGPHAQSSREQNHWAHWRRELSAYQSGTLPHGPGLRAPRLLGVAGDALYVEYVGERQPVVEEAALELGRWHHRDHSRYQSWHVQDQLAQRLAVTDLDWSAVDVASSLAIIWSQRQALMTRLDALPRGITHGDFSTGNLRADDRGVVAIDWATLGVSPVGFDLAHLALAGLNEHLVPIYLDGLQSRYESDDVRLGYRTAVSLIGASRAHWMAIRSIPLPAGYTDFVEAHRP